MAEYTSIEWTTHTLNWWTGCEEISPGCCGCYANSWANRRPNPLAASSRPMHAFRVGKKAAGRELGAADRGRAVSDAEEDCMTVDHCHVGDCREIIAATISDDIETLARDALEGKS